MTTQRESRLSRRINQALTAEGWFCFKIHGGDTMMSGLPDLIVCARGRFIGLEVKHPETRDDVSARQRLVHQRIERAGGVAQVVTSASEAVAAVKQALREAP